VRVDPISVVVPGYVRDCLKIRKFNWCQKDKHVNLSPDPLPPSKRRPDLVFWLPKIWCQDINFCNLTLTGHCGLWSNLQRIGMANSSQSCQCLRGQGDQTPYHILQDCPLFGVQCQQTWLEDLDTKTKLGDGGRPIH
jgi:hypothetical protein